MGLLTSNPVVTEDVGKVFNHLSGLTQETNYRRLLVAPHGIRAGLLAGIDRELAHQQAGRQGHVRFKVNSLVDEKIIDRLYKASQAGVKVDLWVRGICTIRPGVQGLSENIRVRSVLGRFLEHSRIFWFANGGQPIIGIGSADLMHRNLDRRVETIVSITNKRHIQEITDLFDLGFDPGTVSWHLEDTVWHEHSRGENGEILRDLQSVLIGQRTQRRVDEPR